MFNEHQSATQMPRLAPLTRILGVLALTGGLGAAAQAGSFSGDVTAAPVSNQFVVRYRTAGAPTTAPAAASAAATQREAEKGRADRAARRVGATLSRVRDAHDGARVFRTDRVLSEAQIRQIGAEMAAADPSIALVEPDQILQVQAVPNDTYFSQQWHYYETLGGINLPAAWDRASGAGINVAVIDTGYRPHIDLAANILPGQDMISTADVGNDGDARDADAADPGDWSAAGACYTGSAASNSSWHGTHVAGTIAAVSGNGGGVAGVAPGAKVVPIRALGRCGGYMSDIADAVVWAVGGAVAGLPVNANPARVLNLSLGGSGACSATMQSAINTARAAKAVVVVAAGNSNVNVSNSTPANCTGVVAVGAVTRTGAKASFSNYGGLVTVSAPGGTGILSTLNAGTTAPGADAYASYQGTSMATPHVAGVAALMLSKNPALTSDQVAAMLKSTARSFPVTFTGGGGAGIINAKAAVDAAMGAAATAVAEKEPNSTTAAAQVITATNALVNGTVDTASDTDYYKVSIAPGKSLAATLNMGVNTGTYAQNFQLYLHDAAGVLIASSLNATGLPDSVRLGNLGTTAVTVFVRVAYAAGGTGKTNGKYTLNLLQQ